MEKKHIAEKISMHDIEKDEKGIEWCTIVAASRITGRSVSALRNKIREGRFKSKSVIGEYGERYYIEMDALDSIALETGLGNCNTLTKGADGCEKEWCTIAEAAKITGLGISCIRNYVKNGIITSECVDEFYGMKYYLKCDEVKILAKR